MTRLSIPSVEAHEMHELSRQIAASALTLPEDSLAFAFALLHAKPFRQDVRQAIAHAIKSEVGSSPIKVAFASEVVSAWVGFHAVPCSESSEMLALAGRYLARVEKSGLLLAALKAATWIAALPPEAYSTRTSNGRVR